MLWGDEEMAAFLELKRILQSNKVLAYPDLRKPFILYTDASDYCIGAILNQKDDKGRERPIAFASRVLDKAQQNYFTTEKECLAIVWAIRHFRVYLIGARTTVWTDHKTLKYIISLKESKEPLSPRLGRWTMALQEYDLDVQYKEGTKMAHVDALSRLPKEQIESLPEGEVEFRYVHTITDDGAILLKEKKREERRNQKIAREFIKAAEKEAAEERRQETTSIDVQQILQTAKERQEGGKEKVMQLDEMIKRASEIEQQLKAQGITGEDIGISGLTPEQMTMHLEAKKLKQMASKFEDDPRNNLGRPDASLDNVTAESSSAKDQQGTTSLGRPDASPERAETQPVMTKDQRNEKMLALTMKFADWINQMENDKIETGQKQYHHKLLYTEEERRNLWRLSRERQQKLWEEAGQADQQQETLVKTLAMEEQERESQTFEDDDGSSEEQEMSCQQMVDTGRELISEMRQMIEEDQQQSSAYDNPTQQLTAQESQGSNKTSESSLSSSETSTEGAELTEEDIEQQEQLKAIEKTLRKQLGLTLGDPSVRYVTKNGEVEELRQDTVEIAETEFKFPDTEILVVKSMKAEEIAELQRSDDELKMLWDYIQDKQLPDDEKNAKKLLWKAEWYAINQQGLLVRLAGGPNKKKQRAEQEDEPDQRLVVPKCLITTVLQAFHSSYYGGHFGTDKLHATIRRRYFWESMYADCQRFCKSCMICQRYKKGMAKKVPLHPIPPTAPFSRVSLDILYTCHESSEGHKYILVFVDLFTKWPEAIAVKDMTAATIAREFVKNIVCRHGCPRELLSDQGTHFTASVFQEVVKRLGIKKLFSTAYHSQTSGQVERFNGILMQILRCYIESVGDQWHEFLPFALMAYRVAVQVSTKESPFKIVYGREPVLPVDLLLMPVEEEETQTRQRKYTEEMADVFHKVWETVEKNILSSQEVQKYFYDRKAKDTNIREGDRVLLQVMRVNSRGRKLTPFYDKMYRVHRIVDTNAWIQEDGRDDLLEVHLNRLKKYDGPWLTPCNLRKQIQLREGDDQSEQSEEINCTSEAEVAGEKPRDMGTLGETLQHLEKNQFFQEKVKITCVKCHATRTMEQWGLLEEPQVERYWCIKCRKQRKDKYQPKEKTTPESREVNNNKDDNEEKQQPMEETTPKIREVNDKEDGNQPQQPETINDQPKKMEEKNQDLPARRDVDAVAGYLLAEMFQNCPDHKYYRGPMPKRSHLTTDHLKEWLEKDRQREVNHDLAPGTSADGSQRKGETREHVRVTGFPLSDADTPLPASDMPHHPSGVGTPLPTPEPLISSSAERNMPLCRFVPNDNPNPGGNNNDGGGSALPVQQRPSSPK